ncbi:GGDEF domain-containing protein [Occallatibacter savannae]|uniref:GGDEF domain-containing protein n=1 Tax=Occallatibacter savannae TaxID=1002691 RepID=UPI000D694062|nr:GGDEF domain-containing protein [Occallatibacter savannae]
MKRKEDQVPESLTVLPDPKLFRLARWTQVISLCVAAAAALLHLLPLFAGPAASARASLPVVLTGLVCAISLGLSGPDLSGTLAAYAARAAKVLGVFGGAVVIFWMRALADTANPMHAFAAPARIAFGFVLLSVAVLLLDHTNRIVNRLVDVLVCVLCLLAVLITADYFYGRFRLFGSAAATHGAGSLIVCLVALTSAVTLRQAEHGVLSVFLGIGSGSKMARLFAPILLVISFAWEALNARVHQQFAAGLLAAAAVAVFTGILLLFAWRISRMENEIHELILRDDATRLYNSRGFHLLAEHALRLAKRNRVPFSILFIEMENLAQIHSEHGPQAAAASLAEAGEILRATFRESDIKGRIGAGDFAVAGQFDRTGISVAALRLEFATAARASRTQGPRPLKLSMGHVTTLDSTLPETLQDLIDRAGQVKNRMTSQMTELTVN